MERCLLPGSAMPVEEQKYLSLLSLPLREPTQLCRATSSQEPSQIRAVEKAKGLGEAIKMVDVS